MQNATRPNGRTAATDPTAHLVLYTGSHGHNNNKKCNRYTQVFIEVQHSAVEMI